MSAEIIAIPTLLALSKENAIIELVDNAIPAASPARIEITINKPTIANSNILSISTSSRLYLFTFKNDIQNNPYYLPVHNGQDENTYASIIYNLLLLNDDIIDDYIVELNNNVISLTSKSPDLLLKAIITTNTTGVEVTFTEAVPRLPQSAYIKLITSNNTITRIGSYDLTSKRVKFNCIDIAQQLQPPVPPAIFGTYNSYMSTNSTLVYSIYYATLYDRLASSDDRKVMYGRLPNTFQVSNYPNSTLEGFACHHRARKQIFENQPDWLCFYTAITGSVKVKLEANLYDNTSSEIMLSNSLSVQENKIYTLGVGHAQVKNLLPPTTVSYSIEVLKLDNTILARRTYELNQAPSTVTYILHSNGFGGVETFAYAGEQKERYNVASDYYLNSNNKMSRIITDSSIEYSLTTLFIDTIEDIKRHMDLLNEPAWLVNTESTLNRFDAITIQTDSIEIDKKDNIQTLSFNFKLQC